MNVFDWLRDEVSKCSDEACFLPGDMMVISESRVEQLLDEAEAKWEEDMRKHDIEVHNEAEIRAKAIDDFVEHITLPLTTEEDIAKILEQLKEE